MEDLEDLEDLDDLDDFLSLNNFFNLLSPDFVDVDLDDIFFDLDDIFFDLDDIFFVLDDIFFDLDDNVFNPLSLGKPPSNSFFKFKYFILYFKYLFLYS